jgi:hypothetical protein
MTIYRADPPEADTIDVELSKKPGKSLGLGFFTSNPQGLLVTDIVSDLTQFFQSDNDLHKLILGSRWLS